MQIESVDCSLAAGSRSLRPGATAADSTHNLPRFARLWLPQQQTNAFTAHPRMHSSGLWQSRLSQVRFGFLAWMLCCCVCAFGPGGPQHLCSCEQKTTQHVLKHYTWADETQSSGALTGIAHQPGRVISNCCAAASLPSCLMASLLSSSCWYGYCCPCRCWHWHVHHRGGVSGPAAARLPAAGDCSPAARFCRSRWVWPATALQQ